MDPAVPLKTIKKLTIRGHLVEANLLARAPRNVFFLKKKKKVKTRRVFLSKVPHDQMHNF